MIAMVSGFKDAWFPASALDPINSRNSLASIADIDRWLSAADYADVFVYAVCPWLPIAAPGGRRMYALAMAGLVNLTKKRSDLLKGEWAYRAQRTSKPLPEPEAPAVPRRRLSVTAPEIASDEAASIDLLLPLLKRAARHGRPCPTDAQMADRTGIPRSAIPATLAAMRAAHLIRIEGVASPTLRLITILATGHRTGFVKP